MKSFKRFSSCYSPKLKQGILITVKTSFTFCLSHGCMGNFSPTITMQLSEIIELPLRGKTKEICKYEKYEKQRKYCNPATRCTGKIFWQKNCQNIQGFQYSCNFSEEVHCHHKTCNTQKFLCATAMQVVWNCNAIVSKHMHVQPWLYMSW